MRDYEFVRPELPQAVQPPARWIVAVVALAFMAFGVFALSLAEAL